MTEEITSVGIDIGTSTTSVVFSKIYVENTSGMAKVPDYRIVDKKVFYRGPIYLTPLASNTKLDIDEILHIIQKEYESAGVSVSEVDTGAVIITGDTARKENAEEVLRGIAHYAGDFVVATAGPELESILAGKGSGADQISAKNFTTVANFDVGGGTTNISVFKSGATADVACFDIGGRLIRFQPNTLTIDYAFSKMETLGTMLGFPIAVGETLTKEQVEQICNHMADCMKDILQGNLESPLVKFYQTQESGFHETIEIQQATFSGGVGDLYYREQDAEDFAYNDIGVLLARKIKEKMVAVTTVDIMKPQETIGATVVGAGTHTTEVSGSTIKISDESLLPIQNIPVLKIEPEEEQDMLVAIQRKLGWIHTGEDSSHIALALTGKPDISFGEVQQLADLIIEAMKAVIERNKVLIVIVLHDFAKVLGQTLQAKLPKDIDVLVVDGIKTSEGDYVDLGKPLGNGSVLPVIVKTIVFNY